MAADASHALGAPEVAGAFVNPKGMTKKVTAAVAGQVAGGAVGTFAAKMKTGPRIRVRRTSRTSAGSGTSPSARTRSLS